MSINELQDEVIAEFSDFDDWMDRYQLHIDLGNEQEPLEEKYKTEQNLIEGCQSRVWLQADDVDGKIVFKAESDALIVKGIIALLIKVLSGHTPDEILNTDLYFIDKIGLKEHLSPKRDKIHHRGRGVHRAFLPSHILRLLYIPTVGINLCVLCVLCGENS